MRAGELRAQREISLVRALTRSRDSATRDQRRNSTATDLGSKPLDPRGRAERSTRSVISPRIDLATLLDGEVVPRSVAVDELGHSRRQAGVSATTFGVGDRHRQLSLDSRQRRRRKVPGDIRVSRRLEASAHLVGLAPCGDHVLAGRIVERSVGAGQPLEDDGGHVGVEVVHVPGNVEPGGAADVLPAAAVLAAHEAGAAHPATGDTGEQVDGTSRGPARRAPLGVCKAGLHAAPVVEVDDRLPTRLTDNLSLMDAESGVRGVRQHAVELRASPHRATALA